MQIKKDIKKQWLCSLIFYASIYALFFITSFVTSGRLNADNALEAYSELFTLLFFVFLAAYVSYFFAYRRRGTKWLLFTVIASLLIESMFYVEGHWADFDWSMMVVSWGAVLYYCVSSLRLWRHYRSLMDSNPAEVPLTPLDQEARKIRGDWLTAFYVMLGFVGLVVAGILAMLVQAGVHVEQPELAGIVAIIMLIAVLACGALYYFAYHKRGTKWLMFHMVTAPVSGLKELANALSNGLDGELLFVLIGLGINIYFWIHCYRLWKLNRSLKDPATHSVEDSQAKVLPE